MNSNQRSLLLIAAICFCAVLSESSLSRAATAAIQVFSFGANSFGETGLGTTSGNTLVATPIRTDNLIGKTIIQVAPARQHSLLLAEDGSVFSFGWNDLGRTGLGTAVGDTLVATPINLDSLGGKKVTQVAAGFTHNLLLADDGSVYSFGWNNSGRTGLGTDIGSTLVATPINTDLLGNKTISQVAVGNDYSLLLADDGTVFSFGLNGNGRTGLGTAVGSTLIATPINTANLADKTIIQVAAGDEHSLLLANDGTVFSFGSNQNGRTGRGTGIGNTLVATPINTQTLPGQSITQIAAGYDHSLLLTDDGLVFSFGWNDLGRTGLNSAGGDTLIATPIISTNLAGKAIVQISAGGAHNLLLAEDGSVFAFGQNGNGRTGLGTDLGSAVIATPINASSLAGKTVIQVAAGGNPSLLLTVPEPSSLALGSVVVLLALVPRRRRDECARE